MILSISAISETGSDSDTDMDDDSSSSNNIVDKVTRGEERLEKTKVKMYKMDVKYLLFRPSGNSWMKELLPNYPTPVPALGWLASIRLVLESCNILA